MIFRYPGGKGKLVKKFIDDVPITTDFADVFVGGGSVALAVASRKGNELTRIHLNDFDPWLSSFWEVVTGVDDGKFAALVSQVQSAEITIPKFVERREKFLPQDFSKRNLAEKVDAAFNALFFNRTTFSGCLSSGPIGGYDQSGDWHIYVRWNAKRLVKELKEGRELLVGRTEVTCLDFEEAIKELPSNCFIYADPPYSVKGATLYGSEFTKYDHIRLFETLDQRTSGWLLSNDNTVFVKNMYQDYKQKSLRSYSSMPSTSIRSVGDENKREGRELLVFSKEISK